MSYDNDLDRCGPVILDALASAVRGTNIAATVLVDDVFGDRLTVHAFTSEGRKKRALPTDNSANSRVLEAYLSDVVDRFPAARYAVVFLNHGGRVNEMCLDQNPGGRRGPAWLSARRAGEVMRQVRSQMEGRFELLFLQQCARASVDNIYNMRGTAAWVLGSQFKVGAPNTYYAPAIRWLERHPDGSGLELARQIMKHDTDYRAYVCVDGERIAELPQRIKQVASGLVQASSGNLRLPRGLQPCFEYGGESNYDLMDFLELAYRRNRGPDVTLKEFGDWVRTQFIREVSVQRDWQDVAGGMCGLSVFVPASEQQRRRYENYPLHRAAALDVLWGAFALAT
jgi:hypothetical protein